VASALRFGTLPLHASDLRTQPPHLSALLGPSGDQHGEPRLLPIGDDLRELLSFIYTQTDIVVFDLSSAFDQEVRRFESVD
jgi:hypothetical protein